MVTHNKPSRPHGLTVLSTLALSGFLLTVAAPAGAWDIFGGKTVSGSGHAMTQKRDLGAFHTLSVNMPCAVELVQGESESVVIEADDNLIPLIETTIKDGQLTVRTVNGVNLSRSKIRLTIHARSVDALSLAGSAALSSARLHSPRLKTSIAGSGSITIRDLQSDELSVSIAGSGQFEAQGAANAMDVSIAGSGDVSTARLSTQNVHVSIAGSGDATVWVRKALSVSIAGSGDVQYFGEGTVRESSSLGSGRIKRLGTTPPA